MPGTTPRAGLRYDLLSDSPNIENAAGNLAADADAVVVPFYASTAARDTANPTPTQGQVCYVQGTAGGTNLRTFQVYRSSWRPLYEAPLFAYKTAQESVTNSTTFQADDDLFVSVEANNVYTVECILYVDSGASSTPDFKVRWTYPTGATMSMGYLAPDPGNTSIVGDVRSLARIAAGSPMTQFDSGAIANDSNFHFYRGLLVVGSTAGTLATEWAQLTANATATNVKGHSHMIVSRVA